MPDAKLILDHVYDHEAAQAGRVFLTQPVGGSEVVDSTGAAPSTKHGAWRRTCAAWASSLAHALRC